MKKVLLIATCSACFLLAATNARAQNTAKNNGTPPKPPAKFVEVGDSKMPVVSPAKETTSPANDKINNSVNDKLNNSAVNMPKPVKANEPANTQQAKPADVKLVDSRAVIVPKPTYKE